MSKNRASQFRGLTPKQINKAIYGNKEDKLSLPVLSNNKKREKPEKSYRDVQHGDNGLLLNLPFSTTQSASQYSVPEWFDYKQLPEVSIVVPLYNSSASKLMESWSPNEGIKTEFIFIDDNCPNNSKDALINEILLKKDKFKFGVGRIYANSMSQGWCACCNTGAEKANSEMIIFLHPDSVVEKGWLRPLIRHLRKDDVGAVGPLRLSENNEFIGVGGEWSCEEERFLEIGKDVYRHKKLKQPFKLDNFPEDLKDAKEREKISAYCMGVKKSIFRGLGGFSPNVMSVEWSESDLCCFFREKKLKIISQCSSIVHLPSIKDKKYEQGKVFFRNKWVASGRLDHKNFDQIETIVIKRRSAHGDVLLAASVAPALKKKYPKAKIIFCTDHPEVLINNPWIDKVAENYSERWFQLYFDLDMIYEYRPDANIMDAFADAVGVDKKDCDTYIHTESVENLPQEYVVVHAGKTVWAGRNWSQLKFDQISARLKASGHKVVCVGTWSDHKTSVCDIDLRDKTSIPQLADVVMKAKLFIGIDSFPMHIAQVFEVPGVCFFGSIKPETRLINSCIKPVFANGLKCLGCHHRKPTPCTSTTICEVGVQDCINSISVDNMWRQIESLL